jgi:hypothetical protein
VYTPLKVKVIELAGLHSSLEAMRLPKKSVGDTSWGSHFIGLGDTKLAKRLILAGTDHAKFSRGIIVYLKMELQVGWMIEFETYRHGVECLSTSSTMHGELRKMSGKTLAEKKQADLPDKVYTRIVMVSYQALRAMYLARRNHRHPDWQVFCDFVEGLPHFNILIMPEGG